MSAIATEIVVILLLLVVNGVFAMSEIAVVTARRIRLEQRAERGDRGALAALEIAREPTQFLSTVQVGITLIGVLAGAFGGASIAEQLAAIFRASPRLVPYADGLGLAVVVGGITYCSLIIGELVPKRIGLAAPERIASAVARPMRAVSRVVSPLVKLLTGSTNLMLRLLGVRAHTEPGITEEEIRALMEQGAESGVVQPEEHEVVERVFRLGDRRVGALMTPRPDVEWVDLTAEADALRAALVEGRRSLLLACREEIDAVVGFVRAEDLLARCVEGDPLEAATVAALARPPMFVPSVLPAFRLLEMFRRGSERAAVVLDEFGAVAGVVTLADVVDDLIGEFPAPGGAADQAIARGDDGSWLIDGQAPIADVEAALDIVLTEEERPGYLTLAGFVMARLGRRVDRVRVARESRPDAAGRASREE